MYTHRHAWTPTVSCISFTSCPLLICFLYAQLLDVELVSLFLQRARQQVLFAPQATVSVAAAHPCAGPVSTAMEEEWANGGCGCVSVKLSLQKLWWAGCGLWAEGTGSRFNVSPNLGEDAVWGVRSALRT